MNAEAVFVLIKPDAMERNIAGKIISHFEDAFLRIEGMQQRTKSVEWAKTVFPNEDDKLYEFLTARSVLGFIVSGMDAVKRTQTIERNIKERFANHGMHDCIYVSTESKRDWTLFYDTVLDAK